MRETNGERVSWKEEERAVIHIHSSAQDILRSAWEQPNKRRRPERSKPGDSDVHGDSPEGVGAVSSLGRGMVILPRGGFFPISHLCPGTGVWKEGRSLKRNSSALIAAVQVLWCCCYSGARSSRQASWHRAELKLPTWRSQSIPPLRCALPLLQGWASGAGAVLVKAMGENVAHRELDKPSEQGVCISCGEES